MISEEVYVWHGTFSLGLQRNSLSVLSLQNYYLSAYDQSYAAQARLTACTPMPLRSLQCEMPLHVYFFAFEDCSPVQALLYYARVKEQPELNNPALWAKMADCHTQLGNMDDAVSVYSSVLEGKLSRC